MCGRFGRLGEGDWLGRDWSKSIEEIQVLGYGFTSYNAAPKQIQPVITLSKPHQIQLFLWGLIPHDSKTVNPTFPYFNAKSENIHQIYPWKLIFPKQRCLVPAHFFYEWPKINGKSIPGKPPYLFQLKTRKSFSFAGLWDAWKDPVTGIFKPSFTILTTEPNALVKLYHDRMPVILTGENEEVWMNPQSGIDELASVLIPYDPELMMEYPVSPLVGNTRNNDENLTHRIPWKD
jgi:putative SOS response-associated peptidase YedK